MERNQGRQNLFHLDGKQTRTLRRVVGCMFGAMHSWETRQRRERGGRGASLEMAGCGLGEREETRDWVHGLECGSSGELWVSTLFRGCQ